MLKTRNTLGGWLVLCLGVLIVVGSIAPETFGKGKDGKKNAWKETRVGAIPDEFGDLVASSSLASNKNLLVFRNGAGELRLVEVAAELKRYCHVIRRCDSQLKKGARIPNGHGWIETFAGTVPETFGTLADVSTNGQKKVLTFKNDEAQIRIIEYTTALPDACLRVDRQYHDTGD